jgi:RNA polymerase sigma-70 factor, ECF subfamily
MMRRLEMNDSKDERDEALLARFATHGDRDAAGVLVERHQRAAYDLAFRILRVESDAADATQSAFLNLLRGAARFREGAALRTWLYRIVVNEALKLRAARERRTTVESPIDETFAAPSPDRDRLLAALDREVDALDDAHRLPILLHYYRGLGYDEAASVLGCAPGTVGSRLAAAREKLRARLAALGVVVAVPDLESSLRASRPPRSTRRCRCSPRRRSRRARWSGGFRGPRGARSSRRASRWSRCRADLPLRRARWTRPR